MASRPATRGDLDRVTETITLAFADDPVWDVALAGLDGSTAHHAAYWRMFIEGAFGYGTLFMTDGAAAVSVWLPPDGSELSDEGLAEAHALVDRSLAPDRAAALYELWDRFETVRPAEPHMYLSLLATHPEHRGRGIGLGLLADDLARWDAAGVPCYLESTNPSNDHRYERAGFRRIGGFVSVIDQTPVSTMWRSVPAVSV